MILCMNRLGLTVAAVVLSLPMLTACAKSESADNGRVPVAIHGVNHTDDEFSFVLADPLDKENRAGGETINAYGAGGTMCCFNLPKQWRPGLKAEVRATMWLPPTPQNNLPSVTKSYLLDIPAYAPGKAGELWILRTAADEFSLVTSNFQPDHPKWPGKIKGWPVPSVEYQRNIHAQFLKEAQSDVSLFERSLAELKSQPGDHGKAEWEHRRVSVANTLKVYKGPDDTAFLAMLGAEYQVGLVDSQEKLKRVKAAQP